MAHEIITTDGEVVPADTAGESFAIRLARADLDQQITTARAMPRELRAVRKRMVGLATMDRPTAATMLYTLPRAEKNIEGPGVRFAEALAQFYGNNRVEARVVEIDRKNKILIAEGIFHDLETNSAIKKRVHRGIRTSKGYLFSDDMIVVTGNAACSIAMRNAILAGVPRALWWPAYEAAVNLVGGKPGEAAQSLAQAIEWFAAKGAGEKELLAVLKLEDKSKVLPEHIVRLEGMRSAIVNNEASLDGILGRTREAEHAVVDNPLADGPGTATEAKGKKEKAA